MRRMLVVSGRIETSLGCDDKASLESFRTLSSAENHEQTEKARLCSRRSRKSEGQGRRRSTEQATFRLPSTALLPSDALDHPPP